MSHFPTPPDINGQFAFVPINDDDTEPYTPFDFTLDAEPDPTPDFIQQDDDGWTRLSPPSKPASPDSSHRS